MGRSANAYRNMLYYYHESYRDLANQWCSVSATPAECPWLMSGVIQRYPTPSSAQLLLRMDIAVHELYRYVHHDREESSRTSALPHYQDQ